ncbi:3-phosphoserine/phosphohydroxythreonine transaminase, partial [Flavobacteriaceae bacterium]|nr:3-phosphoserine/phosphohydroxythreonine transaminase [Flavobacteriaceae bacterium]
MKIHNFSAGPSILPQEVMEQASAAVLELDNSGLSLIEISHRSKSFISIMEEACELALRLTGLSGKGYKALFLQGGA